MRIINTVKFRLSPACRTGRVIGYGLLVIGIFTGCARKSASEQAQDYINKSQSYYQQAVDIYKDLINKGKELDRLHFELGRLYYGRGEFKLAVEEFTKSGFSAANKLTAISYYRLANFTDALEAFGKDDNGDDEYLYYYGLTCEKLNLFDKALGIYKKIKGADFTGPASRRLGLIEKQESPAHIKDIDAQVDKVLSSAPAQEEYPQAGALILSCDENIEITPQNRQISRMHYIIKILNERGKEDFSETHIDYDSTYEKVELEYARTIRPDGRTVEVGSRHIRDVSKYLNFPLYSNARVFIISFPEISEGASIEYKVNIYRNQLINKKDFIIGYPLQTPEPVIAANFSIDLPEGKTLYIKTLNDEYNNFAAVLMPQIQPKDGRLTYNWQFKNIPQIIPESHMPPDVQINPTLLISTFNNWQDIQRWWWGLAKDKIKADASIKEKVKELAGRQETQEAKAKAIYNFCAQKIRYVAVEYGQAGYEPHQAEDVFKNKYGDCKDQAILLVTMLREAGLTAYPVLIPTKEDYNLNPDSPALFFNHCIAALLLKDKLVFLDPTAETCSFGDLPADDQQRRVLIIKDDGYEIKETPLFPAGHNLIKQSLAITLNSDESISAQKAVFTYGLYDQAQRFWLLYTPPELVKERLNERLQEVSIGAKLDNYSIKNLESLDEPLILDYTFKGPEYLTAAGPIRIIPQLAALDASLVAKAQRRYPIDFGILDTKEIIFEIALPAGFIVKYMPESIRQDSPWLKFSAEYEYKDNKIYFKQKIEAKKNIVAQGEYSGFKSFFEDLAKKIKQRAVLERKNG